MKFVLVVDGHHVFVENAMSGAGESFTSLADAAAWMQGEVNAAAETPAQWELRLKGARQMSAWTRRISDRFWRAVPRPDTLEEAIQQLIEEDASLAEAEARRRGLWRESPHWPIPYGKAWHDRNAWLQP